MNWLPPPKLPPNQSTGYLGYYCRTFLPVQFDLVDHDSITPTTWSYNKRSQGTFRIIEEKPYGGEMHDSQWRVYRIHAALIELGIANGIIRNGGVYVIHDAHRLVAPEFPITITKITVNGKSIKVIERDEFDKWLIGDPPAAEKTEGVHHAG
jgi:hypothetical protein